MATTEIVNNSGNGNDNNNNKTVRINAVLTMVSSKPVSTPGKTCPLTSIDRAMGQHTLHVVFYYRSGSLEFDWIRPALNEVLTLYPNVTGRLSKDGDGNWEVKFTDAGVRLYFAAVNCSVDEWLRFAGGDDEMNLMVCDDLPDDPRFWSPFRMQITEFEGGGTSIALSCPHMLADPTTLALLIKSWTDAHRQQVISHPPFLQPLALTNLSRANSDTPIPPYYAARSEESNLKPSLKMGSATFSFSDSIVKQSLSKHCSGVPNATPFDLLIALFWARIAKLKTKAYNCEQTISLCMDMRRRLSAPLPSGYYGNALYFSNLTLADTEIDDQHLGRLTELVHQHVADVKEEEFLSVLGWLESRKDDQGKCEPPFRMYGPELTCVNMEHMVSLGEDHPLMYMANFDKGQSPAHVSYHVENVEGDGLIFVMPSPEGGLARRVSVRLPEEEIRKLIDDDVIRGYNPILLLSGEA